MVCSFERALQCRRNRFFELLLPRLNCLFHLRSRWFDGRRYDIVWRLLFIQVVKVSLEACHEHGINLALDRTGRFHAILIFTRPDLSNFEAHVLLDFKLSILDYLFRYGRELAIHSL